MRLQHIKFQQSLLAHHTTIPGWLERKDDIDRLHTGNLLYLCVDILNQNVGHRAVGRRQRHTYVSNALGVEVDLVDESQIVDVYGNLGVVYVFERQDYVVLNL